MALNVRVDGQRLLEFAPLGDLQDVIEPIPEAAADRHSPHADTSVATGIFEGFTTTQWVAAGAIGVLLILLATSIASRSTGRSADFSIRPAAAFGRRHSAAVLCLGAAIVAIDLLASEAIIGAVEIWRRAHNSGIVALSGALIAIAGVYFWLTRQNTS